MGVGGWVTCFWVWVWVMGRHSVVGVVVVEEGGGVFCWGAVGWDGMQAQGGRSTCACARAGVVDSGLQCAVYSGVAWSGELEGRKNETAATNDYDERASE